MGKRKRLLALGLALLLLCAGCHEPIGSPDAPQGPDHGDDGEPPSSVTPGKKTYIALAYSPADSMNPFQAATEYNYYLLPLVYEGLFTVNDQFQAENLLCDSYTGDGTEWNFEMKQGVLFHNGAELTARDVEYSIAQAKASALYGARLQNVASCVATGRYSLRIRLGEPDSQLPLLLTVPTVPRNSADEANPAGTGRYQVQAADGVLALSANTSWHGGAVPITEIRLSALYQDSELSYIVGSGVIDAVCFEKPFASSAPIRGSFDVSTFATTDFHYLGCNKNNKYLEDPLVRKAISAALDRDLLVQKAFSGYADPAQLPISPNCGDFGVAAGDPDALLRQAGCSDTDGDGIYNYTDGTNIALRLLVPEENAMKQQAAAILAQSLLGSGIQIEVESVPADQFQEAVAADRFDLFYGEAVLNDQFDLTQMVNAGGSLCYGGASVAVSTYMAALKSAAPGQIEQARETLYRIFADDMPFVPLAFGRGCVVTEKNVMNPVKGSSRNPYWNIQQWAS